MRASMASLAICASLSLAAGGALAGDPASCRSVKFSDVGWTDITATTAVASEILKGLGYTPKTTVLAVPVTYASMKNKDIDVFLGNWQPSMDNDRKPYIEDKSVIEIGANLPTGAKYTLVHYKGSGAASIDVIAGQVPAQVDQLNSAIGHIKAGKLRALAVTSDKRVAELPDVPTVKESGIPELGDFTYSTYTGLFAPAKLPPAVLAKLHDAMVKVLIDPATLKRFADLTAEARPSTPQELADMLDKEDKLVVPMIKKLGIKAE